MKVSMEALFVKAMESSAEEFVSLVAQHQARGDKFIVKSLLSKCTTKTGAEICDALASTTNKALDDYRKLLEEGVEQEDDHPPPPSPPKQQGRRPRRKCTAEADSSGKGSSEKKNIKEAHQGVLKTLHCCAFLASVGLTEEMVAVMPPSRLLPTVIKLHDSLVFLEEDSTLQESIAGLCEVWWRQNLEQKETLIVQFIPFLLSKTLAWGRKKDVQRLYGMRSALALFDFFDESIEDMKHLLIRTVVTPIFLRTQLGKRFISFLFGLDPQLVKELVVIMRSQIPYGRKSILEAYGEILYQAWNTADGACRHEIEFTCIQGLYEAALYASSKSLGASVRTVLEVFASQKTQDGVETMLFWLLEPLLFRALQAANSNVRQNALLVLVDVFPLENPAASKEEKEVILEKQFALLEKLIMDPCPDVRAVAVKVACRILRLFWEIVPSQTTVKLLTKIVDDMSQDSASNSVRHAVLLGIAYLLENAHSHALLKAILPRLGPMLTDSCLAVRVAAADLLLVIKGIRVIQFFKVVPLETILLSLGTDNSLVAQRLTRLLLPSYFPPKVPVKEACKRCMVLLKRSPEAGAEFCKWLLLEGADPKSLLKLLEALVLSVKDNELTEDVCSGALLAVSELGLSLVGSAECKEAVERTLNGEVLASLISRAPSSLSRSHVLRIATELPAEDVSRLIYYGCVLAVSSPSVPIDVAEITAVQNVVLAWGGLDDLLEALMNLLAGLASVADLGETANGGRHSGTGRPKPGNKRKESAWQKVLSSSPSKRSESWKAAVEQKFIAACGAAWQLDIMLAGEETRLVLLKHHRLHELLQILGIFARTTMFFAAEHSEIFASTQHAASPMLSYLKLYMHVTLNVNDDKSQQEKKKGTKMRGALQPPSQHAEASNCEAEISSDFEVAVKEMLECLREMLARMNTSPETLSSPSPSQPRAKQPRCGKGRSNGLHGSTSTKQCSKKALETPTETVHFVTKVVQIISDMFTLRLVSSSVQEVGADVADTSIQWLTDNSKGGKGSQACRLQVLQEHWTQARSATEVA